MRAPFQDQRPAAGRAVLLACTALIAAGACGGAGSTVVAGYELGRPVRSFELPDVLREISAMAAVGPTTVACLQDERGSLFYFDVARGALGERARFGDKGDYEGFARADATFFVLRADGWLLRLAADGERFTIAASAALALEQQEFEGLAWDRSRQALIVAPKDVARGKGSKALRPLYAVDPRTLAVDPQPVVTVHLDEVLAAASGLGVQVPTRQTDAGDERPFLRLFFSDIAVHPETGDFWLLSAKDRALLVVDREGRTKGLRFFSADELEQPEGAVFLPGGELVLASEGDHRPAVLRVYLRAE